MDRTSKLADFYLECLLDRCKVIGHKQIENILLLVVKNLNMDKEEARLERFLIEWGVDSKDFVIQQGSAISIDKTKVPSFYLMRFACDGIARAIKQGSDEGWRRLYFIDQVDVVGEMEISIEEFFEKKGKKI